MLTALAILGSGALSSAASIFNNRRQIDYTQAANDTQVELSNTAHQREVQDLINAGLNPVLSASGSGASVPQLGTPTLDNEMSGISDSIQSAARLEKLDIPLKESQTLVNSAQANNLMAQGELYNAQAEAIRNSRDLIDKFGSVSTVFGGKLGELWSKYFGDKPVEHFDWSPRTMNWLMHQTPEGQAEFIKKLHQIEAERNK